MTCLYQFQANDINVRWSVKMVQFNCFFLYKRTWDAYKNKQINKQTRDKTKHQKQKQIGKDTSIQIMPPMVEMWKPVQCKITCSTWTSGFKESFLKYLRTLEWSTCIDCSLPTYKCQCFVRKKSEISFSILLFLVGISKLKRHLHWKNSWFCHTESRVFSVKMSFQWRFVFWISKWQQTFLSKKAWKSRVQFYPNRLEIKPSQMWGRSKFMLNSPSIFCFQNVLITPIQDNIKQLLR